MKSKSEAGRACCSACCSDCSGSQAHNPFRASTGYLSTLGYVWYPGVLRTVFLGAIPSHMCRNHPRGRLTNTAPLYGATKITGTFTTQVKIANRDTNSDITRSFIQHWIHLSRGQHTRKSCSKLEVGQELPSWRVGEFPLLRGHMALRQPLKQFALLSCFSHINLQK